jgi:hypothetical protein
MVAQKPQSNPLVLAFVPEWFCLLVSFVCASVTSLSAWTPAVFNRHPNPPRFTPIKKPPCLGLPQRQRKASADNRRFVNMSLPGEEGIRAGVWPQAKIALERPALELITRGHVTRGGGGDGRRQAMNSSSGGLSNASMLPPLVENIEESIEEFAD